jgi:hemoglobin
VLANFISAGSWEASTDLSSDKPYRVCCMISRMDENQTDKPSLFTIIGGDDKVRELVDRFYDLMDLEPQFAALRAMHPTTLESSRDKLYRFLSGWSGGPDIYTQKYGAPFLRARHLPFPIGSTERDEWLTCMLLAMRELGYGEKKEDLLLEAFFGTADWMRNKAD